LHSERNLSDRYKIQNYDQLLIKDPSSSIYTRADPNTYTRGNPNLG